MIFSKKSKKIFRLFLDSTSMNFLDERIDVLELKIQNLSHQFKIQENLNHCNESIDFIEHQYDGDILHWP